VNATPGPRLDVTRGLLDRGQHGGAATRVHRDHRSQPGTTPKTVGELQRLSARGHRAGRDRGLCLTADEVGHQQVEKRLRWDGQRGCAAHRLDLLAGEGHTLGHPSRVRPTQDGH